jgi:hypothetical protein
METKAKNLVKGTILLIMLNRLMTNIINKVKIKIILLKVKEPKLTKNSLQTKITKSSSWVVGKHKN